MTEQGKESSRAEENDKTMIPGRDTGKSFSRMGAGYRGMSRRRAALLLAVAVGVVIGAIFGIRWLQYYFTHASTDDARVKGDLIAVSPTVQGMLRLLPIQEGDRVEKGQLIAQIREEDYQAQVDIAAGVVQTIEAELQEIAEANTAGVISKEQRVESLRGKLAEARAALTAAELKLDHTRVTSPIDGVVAKKVANLGEVIKPGQTIAVIVDLTKVWVEANLEETKVQHVRLGQEVDLKVDAYPRTRFTGKVVNIGAAATSEFALIPENRSAGNFTKVTQRIPIKIEVMNPAHQLRPGMMVVVGIDIRRGKNDSSGGVLAHENK